MNSITIITIVVVALLTLVIGGLTWLAYSSCLKSYKLEVNHGLHDKQIKKEYSEKRKKWGLLGLIGSWVTLVALLSLFVTGVVYKVNGQSFSVNNKTALVIKSGSMSDFYNEEIAEKYNNDKSLQFSVGDVCFFEKVSSEDELTIGDVYGYKYKNMIITHRLVSTFGDYYQFRGDNNSVSDGNVSRENIIYHYTGDKIKGIGTFVLFAQSYFGIWSLVGIIGIMVLSEIVYSKIDTINKVRAKELGIDTETKKKKIKNKKIKEIPEKAEESKAEETLVKETKVEEVKIQETAFEEVKEEKNDEKEKSNSNTLD